MTARSTKGIVVSTERHASTAGVETLKAGGNAIDAAVATAFTMAVSYPSCGNICGEGFMLYHGADGTVTTFDFRAVAPKGAYMKMFLNEKGELQTSPWEGVISVGVPGTVLGMELAHSRFGNLPWNQLIEPAIQLAENGFKVDERLYQEMKACEKTFKDYPSSRKVFLKADGRIYQPGETLKQSDLAETLRRIQKHGSHEFYHGETAKLLVEFIQENGGILELQDLADYTVIEREPLKGSYRGYDVYTIGPPSSGVTLIEMLNILEGYDLREIELDSDEYLHLLTETMRLSQRDRYRHLGDPAFNPDLPLDKLTSKEYAAELRELIILGKAGRSQVDDVLYHKESYQTTHYSVVDGDGNSVSVTYTLNGDFGCEIVAEGTGMVLNNSMGDFNCVPGVTNDRGRIGTLPNLIEGGKRPRSSMIPTVIARGGKPKLILGSPGGVLIPGVILQIALKFVDYGLNIYEAVSSKRIHHGWMPDYTIIEEETVSQETLTKYKNMGHKVYDEEECRDIGLQYRPPSLGTAMCIHIDWKNHVFYGAADPRSGDPSAFSVETLERTELTK